MSFVNYIIEQRSRKFLAISLMDMDKSNYSGTIEEWFSDMHTEYTILKKVRDSDPTTGYYDNCGDANEY